MMIPFREGMNKKHKQINLFFPVLQGESSESAEKQQPEKKHQGFSEGKCLCVCLCTLMLLLSGNFFV